MVAVHPPEGPPLPAALAFQQPDESPLEFFARTWVDDGVDTAVEVAQPEDDLENDLRGLQRREIGT